MTARLNALRLVAIAAVAAITMVASLDHARSATLFDTTGAPTPINGGLGNNTGFGLSFQTTANEYTLTKVTFSVARNAIGINDGNIDVRLWDSNAGLPGNQIGGNLGTFPLSGLSTKTAGFQPIVVDGLNIGLSPSTNYWATVTLTGNSGGDSYYIEYITNASGTTTGSLGSTLDADQTVIDDWGPVPNAFMIGSVEAVAVPEPAPMSMFVGAGLVALLTFRRRHSTCGRVS